MYPTGRGDAIQMGKTDGDSVRTDGNLTIQCRCTMATQDLGCVLTAECQMA